MKNGEGNDFLDRDMIKNSRIHVILGLIEEKEVGANWMIISVGLSRMRSVLGS